MTALDIFAWVVLTVLIVVTAAVFIVLAQLPGKIARANNHPQADAINMAGWLGLLLTLGIVWVVAMIWANIKSESTADNNEINQLKTRLAELEQQVPHITEGNS